MGNEEGITVGGQDGLHRNKRPSVLDQAVFSGKPVRQLHQAGPLLLTEPKPLALPKRAT